MDNVAMATGIMAFLLGGYMVMVSQRSGGRETREAVPRSGFPPLVLALHPLVGLVGLVVWLVYIMSDHGGIAWLGLACFVLYLVIGGVLFGRWAGERRANPATHGHPPDHPQELPEQEIPVPALVVHGILVVLTVAFALLAALGIGAARCAGC